VVVWWLFAVFHCCCVARRWFECYAVPSFACRSVHILCHHRTHLTIHGITIVNSRLALFGTPLAKPTCFLLYQRPLDSTASRLWYDYDEEDHRHPMTFYSMVPAALLLGAIIVPVIFIVIISARYTWYAIL